MPSPTVLVLAPYIELDGQELRPAEYDAIIDLRVSLAVGVTSQLSIRLRDPEFALIDSDRFAVGREIKVSFPGISGAPESVFDGEVVGIGSDQNAERPDASELVVTAYDRSHRLGHTTRIRTYQSQKYSDVVAQIAQEEGLTADIEDTVVTFAYLIQTTTNLGFLNEIAFRTGFEWRVEGRTLRFRSRSATATAGVRYGEDLRRLKARFTAASEVTAVNVRSWDPGSKQLITATSKLDDVRNEPRYAVAPIGTSGRTDARSFPGTLNTTSLVAASSDEARQLASALSRRVTDAELSLRAVCLGNPAIAPGRIVEVYGAGTKLSGDYHVATVEHTFSERDDLTTTFTTGSREAGIVDLLGGARDEVVPFGERGLTVGIVTNNKDPDGLARVRVKLPALSDSEESWWARLVTPGGGSTAGLMFVPQIGDEVLVGFEHGDLRRPFVLGGLWGAKAKPPTSTEKFLVDNKVIEWGVRTAAGATFTIRGGQQEAEKHFKLALADGTMLYLGSDKVEVIAKNKSIELKSGQASVLITDRGDVQLTGQNIKINATSELTLNGLNLTAKGSTNAKVEGGASLQLKGGASTTLESSGITAVKGSLVKIN